jgi:DeoR family fructose operon transcriptional repressor
MAQMQFDRRQAILAILQEKKSATVSELASTVYTSEASVRRDLEALESEGYLHRVYGGAVLSQPANAVTPLVLRDGEHAAQKEEIAKRAAELVSDGSTLMLDASSTTRRMLKYLAHRHRLRIFTNNLRVPELMANTDAEIYLTGGFYDRKNHAFVGPAAERFLATVSADLLFFSSQGLSESGEISDVSSIDNSLRRVMLSRAQAKIFLCDSSKLGVRRDFLLCTRHEVDSILCDKKLPWE